MNGRDSVLFQRLQVYFGNYNFHSDDDVSSYVRSAAPTIDMLGFRTLCSSGQRDGIGASRGRGRNVRFVVGC